MRDPRRVLKKILGDDFDLDSLKAPDEDLVALVELLREVVKLRKTAAWMRVHTGFNPLVSPATFQQLLDIPEVNYTEVTDRDLNVTQHSLKDLRHPDDPLSIANINAVLREVYKDLNTLHELINKEYPNLHLVKHMTGDRVDLVSQSVQSLRSLDLRGIGYLLTGWKAKAIELEFQTLFPEATRLHPLRRHLDTVQLEMALYHRVLEINIKWAATGLDLFRIMSEGELGQSLENLTELGNGLWNTVYNGMPYQDVVEAVGIDFQNVNSLLDPVVLPLKNA